MVPDQVVESDRYVVGVDYGTLSGRAVVVRVRDGEELADAVYEYPHGVLDRALPGGRPLPHDWALQVPSDYVEVLRHAVPRAVVNAGIRPEQVIGIGTDFTACTVLPVLEDGTPLCELPDLVDTPHAYVKLWKHHAAQPQADRINALARETGQTWLPRYGGRLSSEWQLAKGLQLIEEAPDVYARMAHLVEAADWITWRLAGVHRRNACTAGYKGVRQDGAYPDPAFLRELHPGFEGFYREKAAVEVVPLGSRVGSLTPEAAGWTGLPAGIAVCAGNVDAHVTAPAAGAIAPGQMVAIMGTSTCLVMNSDRLAEVPGMCGVVRGGITPGSWGYEAGQSGVGDIFAWFVDNCVPGEIVDAANAAGRSVHDELTARAAELAAGESGLVALDWHSGNRSVLVNHELSGLLAGMTLATRPHEIYRALLEATAFGVRTIIEAFETHGVPVRELVVAGGLLKNTFLMQMYADITRRPLGVIDSAQGPALGSAMHAAVAAGAYRDIHAASEAMGRVRRGVYVPDEGTAARYDLLYAEYSTLHDHFGRGGHDLMRRLRAIRRSAVSRPASSSGPASWSPPPATVDLSAVGDRVLTGDAP